MFKTEISSSPLMNEPANTLMNNIRGDRFMGDCSFLVTMRALLYKRGGAGAGKVIKYPVGYMAYFKLGCNRSISCRGTRGPILETRINPTTGYAEYKVKCNFCGDESFYDDRLIQ